MVSFVLRKSSLLNSVRKKGNCFCYTISKQCISFQVFWMPCPIYVSFDPFGCLFKYVFWYKYVTQVLTYNTYNDWFIKLINWLLRYIVTYIYRKMIYKWMMETNNRLSIKFLRQWKHICMYLHNISDTYYRWTAHTLSYIN